MDLSWSVSVNQRVVPKVVEVVLAVGDVRHQCVRTFNDM